MSLVNFDILTAGIRLLSMIFLSMNYPGTWLLGIFAAFCSAYNFFSIGYYAKSAMHITLTVMQCYGWVLWRKEKSPTTYWLRQYILHKPSYPSGLIISSLLLICMQLSFLYFKTTHTILALESLLILLYVMGMNLSIMRVMESWFVWTLYDIINAYVLFHAGLMYNAFTCLCYLLFVLPGFKKWTTFLEPPIAQK